MMLQGLQPNLRAVVSSWRWSWVLRDALVLLLLALVVAAATLFGWQVLAILSALSAVLVVGAWLLYRSGDGSREWLLWLLLGGLLALPMLARVAAIGLFGPWQLALLGLSVLGIARFAADVRESGWLKLAVWAFAVSLVLALASSWAGRTRPVAGAYQLFSDLKPLMLVCLGYALRWDENTERWLWRVVKWAWVPMLMFVVFEWAAPGPYFQLLYRGAGSPSVDPTGLLPSRAIGLFEHPSFLASIAALFALLCMGRTCSVVRGEGARWGWLVVVYGLLIVCSVQRQEMAACALALAVIVLLSRPDKLVRNLIVVALVATPVVAAFLFVFADNIQREAAYWGLGPATTAIEIPRAQLYVGAFQLAEQRFPLGSGLGTYAGAGAEKFDASLYYELGFRNYWWFGKQDFLMDTYWPNPIAEMGFAGAGFLLLSYLALLAHAVSRARRERYGVAHGYWLAAAGMMLYTLVLSISSPAFQDPRLFVIPAIMFGVASWQAKRETHALA